MSLDFLHERALERVTYSTASNGLPEEIKTPWVVRSVKMTEESPAITSHVVRFLLVIPRMRIEEWWGDLLPLREAARRTEGIWSISGNRRHHLRGMVRLLLSPAPKSWGWGFESTTIRWCTAHCSLCGLHFSSDTAFDQHCREGHEHPSKSKKLLAVKERDTGCSNMGTAYDTPICKHLPYATQTYHYVPGVRVWEHINAARVREHFADRR